MTLIEGEKPDPWDQFETCAEVLAFVHKQLGLDGVREVLKLPADERESQREFLEMTAAELTAAGLRKVAKVVSEFAADAPSALDLRFCDYATKARYLSSPTNHYNIEAWRRQQSRLVKAWQGKHNEFLRRAGIDPDRFLLIKAKT